MHNCPTFVELLRERAQSHPDRLAFSFWSEGEAETDYLTYGELDRRARAIAAHLQARQLAGARALLLYAPNLDFITGFLGCLYAQVTAVPAYPPRSAQMMSRLTTIIEDAQAAIALTSSSLLETISHRFQDAHLTALADCLPTDCLDLDAADQWRPSQFTPEALAFLQYTSGSTGRPKGVMITHGNLIHNSRLINHAFEDTVESQGVSWLPPYHDMGLIGGVLQPLFIGSKTVLIPPVAFLQRPYRWLAAISKVKATTSGAPNFAYELCAKQIKPEQRSELDLSSWTLAFSGAEPIRSETLDLFAETFACCGFQREAFFPCYGMAETTLIVSGAKRWQRPVRCTVSEAALTQNQIQPASEDVPSKTLVSSGHPLLGLRVTIVDPKTHRALPEGQIGEIWVAGESVAQGYWGQPQQTQESFAASIEGSDPSSPTFLRTGDLGFLQQGDLYVTGRLKDLIIIRGRNHYPQDIEATVQTAHSALRVGCVAAFSVEQADQEVLVIVQEVERTALRRLDSAAVTRAIRQAVVEAHQLQPSAIVLLKTGGIPKTSSGKIQRFACRQRYLDQSLPVVGQWQASDPEIQSSSSLPLPSDPPLSSPGQSLETRAIQDWLVHRLAQQLNLSPQAVDIREPLSSFGLDSLAAVRLTADLEDWLAPRSPWIGPLSPTLIFDYPTIAQISQYLGTCASQPQAPPSASPLPGLAMDDIAVIGMACRFPGADTLEAFWQILEQGQSAITQAAAEPSDPDMLGAAPVRRFQQPMSGGFLRQVDGFDAAFFGISPREAEHLDPQQRLLLEVAWESFEQAGLPPHQLAGTATGVFVGISSNDYAQLQANDAASVYSGTGNAHSVAANRLSYLLDLHGPSLAVDTACSSSLVAVHLASQSLRQGECDCALAAGVNVILDEALTETFRQAGMLAPDGTCKTFDAEADGYVRGEGCGVVILKRLTDAQREGNPIWGVIRGSAMNQDGRSNGLTAPNGLAQQAVIRQALAQARIEPQQVSYIEAHGTGTALGDPIEVNALRQVFLPDRRANPPCWLGSVKTNVGHLEAAAGMAGLIKVLLALQHRKIPPHLHLKQINPLINLAGTPLQIPTQLQPWEATDPYAGVSSFGFGGTNAHVILGAAPDRPAPARPMPGTDRSFHLLTLSAKTPAALTALKQRYAACLGKQAWADLCHSANVGRSPLTERCVILSPDVQNAQILLTHSPDSPLPSTPAKLIQGPVPHATPPTLAFLFTGQGAQYPHMGRELFETHPDFRAILEECDRLLRPELDGVSLLHCLFSEAAQENGILDQTRITQPALFALEYALCRLWQSWGVQPDWVMGHSVGEYVAACIAGVFPLAAGLKLIAARARLMESVPVEGGMVVVFESPQTLQEILDHLEEPLVIAAYNGPENTVVSGSQAALVRFEAHLQRQGIKHKRLPVSQAFHSPLMEPMLAEFRQIAAAIDYQAPQIPIVSNVTRQPITAAIATADYWCEHVLAPVGFWESLQTLEDQKVTVFLEIGPKPTLTGMGRRCLAGQHQWLPSLRPGRSDWQQIQESLGQLFLLGYDIDWQGWDRGYGRQRVSLPTYPWQRRRYWLASLGQRSPSTQPSFYTVALQPLGRPPSDVRAGQWLFVGSPEHGQACAAVLPAHQTLQFCPGSGNRGREDWIADLRGLDRTVPLLGILEASSLSPATLLAPDTAQGFSMVALLQALEALGWRSPQPRLWMLTDPASEPPAQLGLAALAGLGKGIQLEHPECWGGLIQMADPRSQWLQVVAEINSVHQPESRIVYRQGDRYVDRLLPWKPPTDLTSQLPLCHEQGLYLITGGLGSLGLQTAQWLVRQGAQALLLVGRTAPSPQAQRILAKLEAQGVALTVIQADIAQAQTLDQLRRQIFSQGRSLLGIIHAAGVIEDHALLNLSVDHWKQVMAPKVQGAWLLHELSLDHSLDFFVCFSSVASVLGSPGQSHYSAANAGLDALAHYRQSQGLPALSINWGPWSEAGMATSPTVQRSIQRFGLQFLTPTQGFQQLDLLLRAARDPKSTVPAQIGCFIVDWATLSQAPGTQGLHPFLSAVLDSASRPHTKSPSPLDLDQLQRLSIDQSAQVLLEYLKQTLARILQVPAAQLQDQDHLMEMGADSLMVMDAIAQIQKDLDLMVYPREIYEHPHLESLARYLAREFHSTHGSLTPEASEPQAPSRIAEIPRAMAPRSTSLLLPSQKLPGAVLILSSPRAGSTLLRVMLAGHDRLFSPPELHLLPFGTMAERERDLLESHLGEGLQRALMDLCQLSAAESQAQIQRWQEEQTPIYEIYRQLQTLAGDRLLVDKSPTYAMQLDTLQRAEALFDQPKYIHLVRHPYAMIESFVKLRMDKLIGAPGMSPYSVAEQIWTQSNQNILQFRDRIDPHRLHCLTYETLVTHPRTALKGLCDFLEIPFRDTLLHPYEGDRLTDGVHRQSMSVGDPNFLKHRQIDATLADQWRRIHLPQPLRPETQQLAMQLGYELPTPALVSPPRGESLPAPDPAASAPMRESVLNVRGLDLCLCEWGPRDGDPILCLHGILDQGLIWEPVAMELVEAGYRVVAPDLRGHGKSDHVGPGGGYHLLDFLGDIVTLVEGMIDRPMFVIGHSLGSVVAGIFTRLRSQLVRHLILVEPVLPRPPQAEDALEAIQTFLEYTTSPPKHTVMKDLTMAVDRLRKAIPSLSLPFAQRLAERGTKPHGSGLIWRWDAVLRSRMSLTQQGGPLTRASYLKILSEIPVPLTAVYGDRSTFNRPEDLAAQHSALPHAQRIILPGGHNIALDAASDLAQCVLDAADRLTSSQPTP